MSETTVVVALLVAIGIVAVIVLVAGAARARSANAEVPQGGSYAGIGMSLGMLFGAALGTIVWASTGEYVFWVIFMGAGMTLGLALGDARATGRR